MNDDVVAWKLLTICCCHQANTAIEQASSNIHNCKLATYDNDVGKCLDYIQNQVNILSAGDVDFYAIQKKILDLLIATTNDEFRSHVQSIATLHQLKQISLSPDQLMTSFENKWSDIKLKSGG